MLLARGARVDISDEENRSPLLIAFIHWHTGIMKALINHGLDINEISSDGRTILMRAAEAGNVLQVRFLLECGAELGITDSNGKTALMLAEEKGHDKVVGLLNPDI